MLAPFYFVPFFHLKLTDCVLRAVRPLTEQEIGPEDSVSQIIAMKDFANSSRPNTANTIKTFQTTQISSKF